MNDGNRFLLKSTYEKNCFILIEKKEITCNYGCYTRFSIEYNEIQDNLKPEYMQSKKVIGIIYYIIYVYIYIYIYIYIHDIFIV